MEHHSADACIEDASSMEWGYCWVGKDGKKFSEALPGTLDSGCDRVMAATSATIGVTEIAESGD